jgi:hypothetical protein
VPYNNNNSKCLTTTTTTTSNCWMRFFLLLAVVATIAVQAQGGGVGGPLAAFRRWRKLQVVRKTFHTDWLLIYYRVQLQDNNVDQEGESGGCCGCADQLVASKTLSDTMAANGATVTVTFTVPQPFVVYHKIMLS